MRTKAAGAQYGFASLSTDTGHHSGFQDGSWAWQNPEAIDNWGHKAMHGSVEAAKSIIGAFGGSDDKKADISSTYYSGCSTGGRQGLKEAQEYPDDFDGILAGAPAWWSRPLHLFNLVAGVFNLPVEAAHHIPPEMFPVIAAETLRQCDPQDGVIDNIISSPETCLLQLETLLCGPESDASKCLKAAQLETLHRLYNDWAEANSTFVFPHLLPGSEWEWMKLSGSNKPNSLGVDYVKYFLNFGPDWDWQEGYSPSLLRFAEEMDPGNATADNYDLSPFFKRGGKLLLYHGLVDPGIPPGSTLYFYNQVVQTLMPRRIEVSDHSRVLFIPGMLHCQGTPESNDAPWYFAGANQPAALKGPVPHSVPGFSDAQHNAMLALMDWVEKGRAPTEIIATKWANDDPQQRITSQRPACMYPQVAKFQGGGGSKSIRADVRSPKNWVCENLWN
ncbi:hypothetical protein FJTKL_15093 [Diaporthe vaccinii]|uniref:Carboxylic ester hydrolase n=1 Tax=Diaporthe vaccinii TaxID=105482 RepID=A0ABR4E6A8_9PEZI